MSVTQLVITSRQPFARGEAFGSIGAYEQLDGKAFFAVRPDDPANRLITDLNLAPRDASGLVHFAADFRVLRPVHTERSNRRILFDVLNRGKALALRNLNSAPDIAPHEPLHAGNGFLMRHGYSVAWCGWQHDVPDAAGLMRIHTLDAVTPAGPVCGKVAVTFQPTSPSTVQFLSNSMHRPYMTNDIDAPQAVLTEQDHEDAPERVIPRQAWAFARLEAGQVSPDASHVYMASGFQPGKVYQVIYATTGAPIVGLGLLATRDLVACLRYGSRSQGNPCADAVDRVYGFGVSQSGRFLRAFLHLGLNQDEQDRTVFDGVIPHVAGGKRGEFNHRFAQPSSQASRSPNNLFPFSDTQQEDPETGCTDGLLARLMARRQVPKIMHTYTSSEYWAGHGALVHVDLSGTRDLALPEAVRVYHFSGTQHGLDPFTMSSTMNHAETATEYRGRHAANWLDYRPLLRAALVNLDRWVTSDATPPPSRYPRLDDRTAVPPETLADWFKSLPDVHFPPLFRQIQRLNFGPDAGVPSLVPPVPGKPYPCLVCAVDEDGNEVAGIRLPYHTVPLATYTGWNLRHPEIGGPEQILASGGGSGGTLIGSTLPFASDQTAREASGDMRRSIAERYASKEAYLALVEQAAQDLVEAHYLLAEDVASVVEQAAAHYDWLRHAGP